MAARTRRKKASIERSIFRFASEVSIAKDGEMMLDVAGDDESESAHGEGFAVSDAVTGPCAGRQILEEANGGEADEADLLDVIEPRNAIGLGTFRADVLVVAGKRRFKSSRKPEGAKGKCALGVRKVIENLADTPFIGGVAVER